MYKLKDKQISPVDIDSRKKLNITSGDTVKVWQKITEKGKVRLQGFEGTVIARKHGGEAGATITVRRVGNDGIGIEKIFPLYSPNIDKIEVVKRVKTRRSKLYFLRIKTQKQVRDKLRRALLSKDSSVSETQQEKEKKEEKVEVDNETKQEKVEEKQTTEEVKEEKVEETEKE